MPNYPRWRWYAPKSGVGTAHVCEQSTKDGRLLVNCIISEIVYLCGLRVDSWQGMRRVQATSQMRSVSGGDE